MTVIVLISNHIKGGVFCLVLISNNWPWPKTAMHQSRKKIPKEQGTKERYQASMAGNRCADWREKNQGFINLITRLSLQVQPDLLFSESHGSRLFLAREESLLISSHGQPSSPDSKPSLHTSCTESWWVTIQKAKERVWQQEISLHISARPLGPWASLNGALAKE